MDKPLNDTPLRLEYDYLLNFRRYTEHHFYNWISTYKFRFEDPHLHQDLFHAAMTRTIAEVLWIYDPWLGEPLPPSRPAMKHFKKVSGVEAKNAIYTWGATYWTDGPNDELEGKARLAKAMRDSGLSPDKPFDDELALAITAGIFPLFDAAAVIYLLDETVFDAYPEFDGEARWTYLGSHWRLYVIYNKRGQGGYVIFAGDD